MITVPLVAPTGLLHVPLFLAVDVQREYVGTAVVPVHVHGHTRFLHEPRVVVVIDERGSRPAVPSPPPVRRRSVVPRASRRDS